MVANVYRDFATLPEAHQRFLRDRDDRFGRVPGGAVPGTPGQRRRVRALIGHAASFWTWHSLCVNEGLSGQEAVKAMTGMVRAAISAPPADPAAGIPGK